MAIYCAHCKEKIGMFSESYNINNDVVLCGKCASPIGKDFCSLYTVKTKVVFDNLKEKICENAKSSYSEDLADIIYESVKNIEDSRTYFDDIGEVNNPKNNEEFKQEKKEDITVGQNTDTENFNSRESESVVSGLFDNIGGKLKIVAKIFCWLGIIASVIGGIALMSVDDDMIGAGIATLIGGSVASWLSALGLYAFGQLVENTDKLVKFEEEKRNSDH